MADLKQIQFKRSNVAGKRPSPTDIAEGELAINIKDATLFTKNADGAIIDLGFAKGGRIDGDVVHVGKYTQTGDYITSGSITSKSIKTTDMTVDNKLTVELDLEVKRDLVVAETITAGAEVVSKNGVLRSQASGSSNAHVWFQGTESGALKERGVFYALPQTETSGSINLRVMDGYKAGQGNATFGFTSKGEITNFTSLIGHQLISTNKPITEGENAVYTIDNRVTTNSRFNFMRAFRANAAGTIFHELCDSQNGSEISLYTGKTAVTKIQALKDDGRMWLHGSVMVGGAPGQVSSLGVGSIAIGDNDSGFRAIRDGEFEVVNNNRQNMLFNSSNSHGAHALRGLTIRYTDGKTQVNPPDNTALLQVDTSLDGNNSGGNGLTLIGYKAAVTGKYHHYFRGSGALNVNTLEGINVDSDAYIKGRVTVDNRINANAGIMMSNDTKMEWSRNTDFARISFKNTGDADADSYMKFESGDNGNEYFKFISVSGTTERPLMDIRYGDSYSNFKFGIGGQRNTFGSNNSLSLGWGQTGIVAEGANVLTTFANGQWNNRAYDDGSLEINGARHAATHGHQWTQQFGQRAPVHINTGAVAGSSDYYPAVRHVTQASGFGYRTALDFGTLREGGGQFGVGIIRVATDERAPGDGQDSIFKFTINGSFVAPGDIRGTNIYAGGARLGADGNITNGSRWNQGNGDLYGHIESRCSAWARQEALKAVQKTGDVMTGLLQWHNRGTNIIGSYNGDGAGWDTYNMLIRTHWGLGFQDYTGTTRMLYDARGGILHIRGGGIRNTGTITSSGDITSSAWMYANEFYLNSDARYKNNIIELESVKDKLHSVPVHRYSMKDGSNDNAIGVIAQEVEAIFPELVTTKEDGYKSVNYRALSTVLWKIVQEQDKELEDVKSRLARIEELLSK